jgi:hypothetical protein
MSRGKFGLNMTNDLETKQSARLLGRALLPGDKKNRKINLNFTPRNTKTSTMNSAVLGIHRRVFWNNVVSAIIHRK